MADFEAIIERLKRQKHLLLILQVVAGLFVYFILLTLLIHFESDSKQSALVDYTNAIWYSVVTLTTVGYGDLFPVTIYGRIIGYIFVFLSLGIYGLLIGQFTNIMATIKENRKLGYNGTTFENHMVIIGWNDFGRLVTDQLIGVGKQIAIITSNKEDTEFIHEKYSSKNIFILYTEFDNYEMLKKANIEMSNMVFVNLDNDTEKLVYILNVKKIYNDLDFVVTLDNGDLKNTFLSAGVANTISKHEISSKLLASYMFEPDVAGYSESMMSYAKSDSDYDVKQFLVSQNNPYINKSYHEAFYDLKKRYNCVLIGITKRDKFGKKKLIKNPLGELKVSSGDYLLILLNGKAFKILKKIFKVDEGYFRERKITKV